MIAKSSLLNKPVLVTIAGILVALICLICFQTFDSNRSSFTLLNKVNTYNRQLLERELPKRTIQEESLIPAVTLTSTAVVSPQTPVKSNSWSLSSWFTSNNENNVETSKDIRQNSNFINAPNEKKYTSSNPTLSNSITTISYNNTSFNLNKEQCKNKYGERKFLSVEDQKFPPMLYTFPGSGNTWCRLLIEYATGIYTGSVYNDQTLLSSLPGEFTCNKQVSVIKIHPHTHSFESLRTGRFQSDARKCQRGGIDKIKRAILLIRDPFDSIWSEYQRRITQSHVGGILKTNFNWPRWQANAAALSHQYNIMWAIHHTGIEKHFSNENILYIKYEDLKNKSTRVDTIQRVVDFLHIATPSREQLECSFLLADKRDTHRIVDKTTIMSKNEAYTIPLVCRMWALFSKYAIKHGYNIYNNIDCSVLYPGTDINTIQKDQNNIITTVTNSNNTIKNVYPPIPRVNVGGKGEYDRKWVKTGQFLLDFGGHPTIPPTTIPNIEKDKPRFWRQNGNNNGKTKNNRPKKPGFIENNANRQISTTTDTTSSSARLLDKDSQQNKAIIQAALKGYIGKVTTPSTTGGAAADATSSTSTTSNNNVLLQLSQPLQDTSTTDSTSTITTDSTSTITTNNNLLKRRNRRNRYGNIVPTTSLSTTDTTSSTTTPSIPALEASTIGMAVPITPKIITQNSVDIGGKDKADVSNWLTQKLNAPTTTGTATGSNNNVNIGDNHIELKNNLRSRKNKKKFIRKSERLGTTTSIETTSTMDGMNMNIASQKDAVIATVGDDKPAWQA